MKYSYILVLAVCKSLENKLKFYPKTLLTCCIIISNPLNTAVSRKVVLQMEKTLRDNVESYYGWWWFLRLLEWTLEAFQRGGRKQHLETRVFVLSRSLLLNHLEPQSLTTHNANRHCRVRFFTFTGQPSSKQLYISRRASHQAGGDFMIPFLPKYKETNRATSSLAIITWARQERHTVRLSALNTPAQLLISFPGFLRT